MGKYVEFYHENNAKELTVLVNSIIRKKWANLPQMYHDDLYDIASDTLMDCEQTFDESKGVKFETYLYNCLLKKFITADTFRKRDKRCNTQKDENGKAIPIPDYSFDMPINEDGVKLDEIIASDFNIDDHIIENHYEMSDEKIEKYLNSLSILQRQIIELKMNGYSSVEIREQLNISNREYLSNCNDMKSFRKLLLLKKCDSKVEEDEMKTNVIQTTMEKSKPGRLSVASINKKIDKHTIRFDHPLQRESDQWTTAMKSNLISDIAQGNPIPPLVFAEQVMNGIAIIWDLDGKQRCTNVYSFVNDGYKISKSVRRYMIPYQVAQKDNEGNEVFDEEKFPMYDFLEFDIRGKKFSQFPEELQEKILDYNFEITQYLNCSSEDIAYHIARYNEGKPMNASQKSLTRLHENFATMIKSISNMEFFKDRGGYKVSEFNNGTIQRVIIESIMATNFLENWKKKPEDMCEFLSENATETIFDNFEDMVNNLSEVITDETANMFDSKDSFLWFGLYAKFSKFDDDGKRFIDFMAEFSQSLHSKVVEDITFDELNDKSTKDKAVVLQKMNLLEKLMMEYLGINKELIITPLDFVKQNIAPDTTEEDIELCEEILSDLTINVDNNSKLLEDQNHLSIIGIVVYSLKNEVDLDNWFVDYFETNKTYIKNQRENYLHMVDDLKNYISKLEKISA